MIEIRETPVTYFCYFWDIFSSQVKVEHFWHQFSFVLPGLTFSEDHSFADNQFNTFNDFLFFWIDAYLLGREQFFPKTWLDEG